MKDYSLLTFEKNKKLFRNWTATYLTELNSKTLSLFNYTNYFIPDFLKENTISNYNDLEYHHWYRVQDTDIDWTAEEEAEIRAKVDQDMPKASQEEKEAAIEQKRKDLQQKKSNKHFLGAKAGYAILSYARNENDYDIRDDFKTNAIRQNSSYYSIVPAAWGGFYDIYIDSGSIYFDYDQYAEEQYGRTDLVYNMDMFTSRFFTTSKHNGIQNLAEIIGTDGLSLYARRLTGQVNETIIDIQGHNWTNIKTNPVMSFTYYKKEEIILDTNISYSRVAGTNIARYNITRRNNNTAIAPQHTCVALI